MEDMSVTGNSMKQLLGLLVILLSVSFCSADPVTAQSIPPDNVKPLDIILLIDSSTSMEKTDPGKLRVTAATYLLDYLAAISQVFKTEHRAGIINFGGNIGSVLELQSVSDGTLSEEIVIEKLPFTDFRPALDLALTTLKERDIANTAAIILLTDGSPDIKLSRGSSSRLADSDKQNYFLGEPITGDDSPLRMNQIVDECTNAGVKMFVVAIGDATADRDLWESLHITDYQPIDSSTNLVDIFHGFLADLMNFDASHASSLIDENTLEVQLQPYIEEATFSFIKDNDNVNIELIDPHGTVKDPTLGGDLHAIFVFRSPSEGIWKIRAVNGKV